MRIPRKNMLARRLRIEEPQNSARVQRLTSYLARRYGRFALRNREFCTLLVESRPGQQNTSPRGAPSAPGPWTIEAAARHGAGRPRATGVAGRVSGARLMRLAQL